ncbi:helicase-related protein [Auritidibacter sp. NML100628]|uniref:helicase-related protein n=1 Tax=Auritidibacter sp. NML100628 TaxID=2170742 RepID=UPI000D72709C|nr:helicase-related protein [Auritidibacter sp. NML100628]PXA75334.1 helicase [Auritidibacter sp. NML100628]
MTAQPELADSSNGGLPASAQSSSQASQASSQTNIAPGSIVLVRDEEWLVTDVRTVYERANHRELVPTKPANRIDVVGVSELVRDMTATFFDSIDHVQVLDPREAPLMHDASPQFRDSRLWLEAALSKTALPAELAEPTLSDGMLIDVKDYQQTPVRKILDPANLRPRILLADAVGLGKTIEIGLILSELIRRGRGERILIVTPKHVLEQMQHEMWTKFAIPFIRLDSQGIQAIRRKLPATRNPFAYFKRVIISIDTLKSDRYMAHLRRHTWDAVVIDESHNVTNQSTLNNRLASVLSAQTDALILASATPHNGKKESFAELIRLLEPTAVLPGGDIDKTMLDRLVVRRHRYSDDVRREVGADWAEREEPRAIHVPASPKENELARELDEVWLHPQGSSPYSGERSALFPWTLAKAFLSSPTALLETVTNRLARLPKPGEAAADSPRRGTTAADPEAVERERRALGRLQQLAQELEDEVAANRAAKKQQTGKYGALLNYLKEIGISSRGETRAVVFAERVATLESLQENLKTDLKLRKDQVGILHGGLSDEEQQDIVESFKRANSPLRVLVTGDVASEGVNLHSHSHHLVHYDIPWSLIRIEQRNGRIDRYGQTQPPQITTLVLDPDTEGFAGDIRVLKKLIEKENQAHKALGDAAALMGRYTAEAEERAIREALDRREDIDTVIPDVDDADFDDFFSIFDDDPDADLDNPTTTQPEGPRSSNGLYVYDRAVDFLRDSLASVYNDKQFEQLASDGAGGGVGWDEHPNQSMAELQPPHDLMRRLEALPQSYRTERDIKNRFLVATSKDKGRQSVDEARNDPNSTSLWPAAHFLGPLHPLLEWSADRALSGVEKRGGIYAVTGTVEEPHVLMQAALLNERGLTVSLMYRDLMFPKDLGFALQQEVVRVKDFLRETGIAEARSNAGTIDLSEYQPLVAQAFDTMNSEVKNLTDAAAQHAEQRVRDWMDQTGQWRQAALELNQTQTLKQRTHRVVDQETLISQMKPSRTLIRPLVLVVPESAADRSERNA